MMRSVTASAPGRICLAGEDLDWMVGPSVLAAISLRISATVSASVNGSDCLVLESGGPFSVKRVVPVTDIACYDGHVLDYARAAVVALARTAVIPLEALHIKISSEVPPAAGLSSSAAVIVAVLGALCGYYDVNLSREQICGIGYSAEKHELGTGAGQMDFYSCALGGVIHIDSSTEPPRIIERLDLPPDLMPVIVDTRVRHSTKDSIAIKRERFARGDPDLSRYVDVTMTAVSKIRELLANGQSTHELIGASILSCHRALSGYMRVSTDLIDRCVLASVAAGSVGAKLTGSGFGGCMFALVDRQRLPGVVEALSRFPVDIYQTDIDRDGLVVSGPIAATGVA